MLYDRVALFVVYFGTVIWYAQICHMHSNMQLLCLQMTALDIAQTVSQLCEVSNTDRMTAMAALRRAIQENVRGKDAITNRAAEILLMS
jgi:hypothetical protein